MLRSHVIDGRAVVPASLVLEWLVQGALQRNPGLAFLGVDDFAILKGAVLQVDRPETVSVLVGKAAKERDLAMQVSIVSVEDPEFKKPWWKHRQSAKIWLGESLKLLWTPLGG